MFFIWVGIIDTKSYLYPIFWILVPIQGIMAYYAARLIIFNRAKAVLFGLIGFSFPIILSFSFPDLEIPAGALFLFPGIGAIFLCLASIKELLLERKTKKMG